MSDDSWTPCVLTGRSDLAPWPIALGHSVRHRQLSLSPWVVSVSCSTKPLTSLNISHQEPLALYWPFRSPFWLLWIMKCYRRICALGQQCWHSTVYVYYITLSWSKLFILTNDNKLAGIFWVKLHLQHLWHHCQLPQKMISTVSVLQCVCRTVIKKNKLGIPKADDYFHVMAKNL